jgi:hypothetical protein
MRIFFATLVLMLISATAGGTFGYFGGLMAVRPYVRRAERRGDRGRHHAVPSNPSLTQPQSVLTDSEGGDPGMVTASTEQPAPHRPLPTVALLAAPRSIPIDWQCRWCNIWASWSTRPRTLVQDEHAGHMLRCPLRPQPPQGARHQLVNG